MTGGGRGSLARELAQALPVEQRPYAVAALANAVRDLRGSIISESMPEMAYRLALFRLNEPPSRLAAARGCER